MKLSGFQSAVIVISLMLASCTVVPNEAFTNRNAEALLQSSREVVNLNLDSDNSISTLKSWIGKDSVPAYAELGCASASRLCNRARKILEAHGVEVREAATPEADIKLVFDNITAMDCDASYKDNPINPHNFNHPAFGCALSANIVRMVSDRRQFTNPEMRGDSDGKRSATIYGTNASAPLETFEFGPINESN